MSTIKVNNIEPLSGTDVTIPAGKNLVITDGLDANTITSGTLADARIPANALNSNVDLANLSATNLTSGTVPDARFPATLPAANGAALTALNASNISSGTVSDSRLPANALNSNVDLTNLSASNLTSGTVSDARLPANALNSNVDLTNLSASNLTSGTLADARFPATLPAVSGANLTNLPGGGKVLQFISRRMTTHIAFSWNNNWQQTYYGDQYINITPSKTGSKILINYNPSITSNGGFMANSATNLIGAALFAGSSSIFDWDYIYAHELGISSYYKNFDSPNVNYLHTHGVSAGTQIAYTVKLNFNQSNSLTMDINGGDASTGFISAMELDI